MPLPIRSGVTQRLSSRTLIWLTTTGKRNELVADV
jgi:hypothetical protein